MDVWQVGLAVWEHEENLTRRPVLHGTTVSYKMDYLKPKNLCHKMEIIDQMNLKTRQSSVAVGKKKITTMP